MELVHAGVIPPEDFGLPPTSELKFSFVSDPNAFDLVVDSKKNALYAQRVAEMILFEEPGAPFRQGIRYAAEILDQRYQLTMPGQRTVDRAVFTAHGEQGGLTPNQYWVPGMFSPMPMMGKYFVYYGFDYLPPRELGQRCVERMVYELYSENTGVCRFHRKWVEAIVDEIITAHYHFPIAYTAHQYELAAQIFRQDGAQVHPWQSERTLDIIWQYLEKWERLGLKDESLRTWLARFRENKWEAGQSYWQEVYTGIREAFDASADSISEVVAPFQAAKLDVMVKPQK
jgi:glyceraldehyde-3-phosphate dehydrogenase (ferredoxin)